MPDRNEKIRQSYRKSFSSCKSLSASPLAYHLGRMIEFTWNANAYSRLKKQSATSGNPIIGLVNTDVFRCIEVCADFISSELTKSPKLEDETPIRECWSMFYRLLLSIRENTNQIQDDVALKLFLILFLSAFILNKAVTCSAFKENSLSVNDFMSAKIFPLTQDEHVLMTAFSDPIFGTSQNLVGQLNALSKNMSTLIDF